MTISIPNHSKMTDGTSMTKAYKKKKESKLKADGFCFQKRKLKKKKEQVAGTVIIS